MINIFAICYNKQIKNYDDGNQIVGSFLTKQKKKCLIVIIILIICLEYKKKVKVIYYINEKMKIYVTLVL